MARKIVNIYSDTNADIVDDGSDAVLKFKNTGSGPALAVQTPGGTINLYGDSDIDTFGTTNAGTATLSSNAATLDKKQGKITSESLTTAAGVVATFTITDSYVVTTSRIMITLANGTNTQGIPVLSVYTASAGSFTVKVLNAHASQALNGTLIVDYLVLN